MSIRKHIADAVQKVLLSLGAKGVVFAVEKPERGTHGDYATNAAMLSTKIFRKPPLEIAGELAVILQRTLASGKKPLCEKVEAVKPGFVNFFLSPEFLRSSVATILQEGKKFGAGKLKTKINLEFVSANPTGPLTLASGRGGFFGDALTNMLAFAGAKVTKEYYVNDAGNQIKTLGESVLAAANLVPAAEYHYQGVYIKDFAREFISELGAYVGDPEALGRKVAGAILDRDIKPVLARSGIRFDCWTSEHRDIRQKGLVEKTLKTLEERGLTYEQDGALWLKTSQFGDDKDRVLRKSVGDKDVTYVAVDIPHHLETWRHGYDTLINVLGADHHGDVDRLQAAMQMFSKPPIQFILMQMVRLMENGKEVRMSKRTGMFVTLKELCDEVGVDVTRFFFLMYQPNTHMDFDLTLAKERSEKNPVYYVQYAHARLSNILRKANERGAHASRDVSRLVKPEELSLIRALVQFPELVEDVARTYDVHRLPHYAVELAASFHKFYDTAHVLGADRSTRGARLALVEATRVVLGNALRLMGISAPEQM